MWGPGPPEIKVGGLGPCGSPGSATYDRMIAPSWNYLIVGIKGLFTGISMNQKFLFKKSLCNPG